MSRYDQDWVEAIAAAGGVGADVAPMRLLYVVTDTESGKAAFYLDLDANATTGFEGRLPRGEKADITITAKESTLLDIWGGDRTRDAAFMSGDLKIDGAYEKWLNSLVLTFEASPWKEAWAQAAL